MKCSNSRFWSKVSTSSQLWLLLVPFNLFLSSRSALFSSCLTKYRFFCFSFSSIRKLIRGIRWKYYQLMQQVCFPFQLKSLYISFYFWAILFLIMLFLKWIKRTWDYTFIAFRDIFILHLYSLTFVVDLIDFLELRLNDYHFIS